MHRKSTKSRKPKLSRGNARGGNRAEVASRILAAEERQRLAVTLRRNGTSWDTIARQLNTSRSTVFRDVEKYRLQINEECREGAGEMRRQEDERLDASASRINVLLNPSKETRRSDGYRPLSVSERVKCEEALGKIGDRRAKLWGLYVEEKDPRAAAEVAAGIAGAVAAMFASVPGEAVDATSDGEKPAK